MLPRRPWSGKIDLGKCRGRQTACDQGADNKPLDVSKPLHTFPLFNSNREPQRSFRLILQTLFGGPHYIRRSGSRITYLTQSGISSNSNLAQISLILSTF